MTRQAYPRDISDPAWAIVAPYVTLMTEDAPQRTHSLREALNGLRWLVRPGSAWRLMPQDLPPWYPVYQHTQRWIKAGVFALLVHDLREAVREAAGRTPHPSAVIMDSRTLQSTPESGTRAGYAAAKRRRGSKVHTAGDSMGSLVAAEVTAANGQDRSQVGALALRMAHVMTSPSSPASATPSEAAAAWEEFFRLGNSLILSDTQESDTLTETVLATRR